MIRLTAEPGVRLEETSSLRVSIGGTESNVAVALARLGRRVCWLSALPDNPLGHRIERELRGHGVDTSCVIWSGGRAGIYFMEPGSAPRPTRVHYDRADSAVARIEPDDLELSVIEGSRALHLTGITPALSEGCRASCLRLAEEAGRAGTPLAFDVNYRARLWPPEAAATGIQPLLERAELVFCGADDAATMWGLTGEPARVAQGLLERSSARVVVLTLGKQGALALTRNGAVHEQAAIPVETIDAVGAGDAFAAGFLHRWLDEPGDIGAALRSAAGLAALKMTIFGDNAVVSADDLETVLRAAGADIVR
jgi:2-dehydro-3-deoxygluconokinase